MDIGEIRADKKKLEGDIMELIRGFNSKHESTPIEHISGNAGRYYLVNYDRDAIAVKSIDLIVNVEL